MYLQNKHHYNLLPPNMSFNLFFLHQPSLISALALESRANKEGVISKQISSMETASNSKITDTEIIHYMEKF